METPAINVKVNALDGATGEPISFSELKTFAIRCGPTQHNYHQGQDPFDAKDVELARLLYCANCGDVIRFGLPQESAE